MLILKRNDKEDSNPSFQPERIELTKSTTRIGRSAEHADIVMDSKISPRMISRLHAQITRMDDQYFISCTGMNGMLINSVKRKKSLLKDGDVVVFGGAGVQTSEGSVISKLQSELVYVFRSQRNTIEEKKDDEKIQNKELRENAFSTDELPVVDAYRNRKKSCKTRKGSDKQEQGNEKRDPKEHRKKSTFISDVADESSPGEGTSDGSVLKRKKKSFPIHYYFNDVDKNDDDCNKSGFTKMPSQKKRNSSQSPNESSLSDDAKDVMAVKRKKKRSALPFDSDDDSINSPVKKLHKTDSSTSEIEKENTKEKLKPEFNDKEFLDDLNEELLCCICRELLVLTHALPCSHTFCYECIRDWLRQGQDCPSCRAKASFDHLVPVKVLDNTVDKVASRVLSPEQLNERKTRIQELQDKINGRMDADSELKAEYGHVHSQKEHCEKCNLPISNRLLRWVLIFPQTSSTAYYHFKCFKPPQSLTISQIKIANGLSKTDMKKIRTLIKS
ncbi:E3 ubiquitin-protein ligase CHFR-like [Actinia tenebrosa]|uniref:E3 ubiquitin-protein ligase CHFR n=1 Tax=Actinia tenebrosa TaxID=6105 RepID=A0A6P8IX68_ACTTE|nr:E3 ubiquitin-protein ligase CHFR-like [Actinia tenebrosa]